MSLKGRVISQTKIDDGSAPTSTRLRSKELVDQAERAIPSFMEWANNSVAMVPSSMNDAAQQALAITEKNLKATFEHARRLMNVKDITK